ncbi:sodium:solute symporter [Alteribacillus sp. YIM 98480]|uniref:sodium:solute symporter family protein n=1 Tax=Alteribacillus sp. YIM 98480 TaxID=2606599 RepID=UPI00131CBD9A|nr:sodium:solute symporter family protein [Alteribacillus sp. YIM 98480]
MNEFFWFLFWIGLYFIVLLFVGYLGNKKGVKTKEDYFLASRSFGAIVLFCSILGTNLSSFAMLGAPGAAYNVGFGIFGLISATAFGYIVVLLTVGRRIWKLGKLRGYQTPIAILRDRFQSDLFAILMFGIFFVFTGGYVVTGLIGGGIALSSFTNGAIPFWLGALIVLVIIAFYVLSGGMRGTAWTNVVQVTVFMVFLLVAFFSIWIALGGAGQAMQNVIESKPELLQRANMPTMDHKTWFSNFIIFSACLAYFPHILLRMMAAKSSVELKKAAYLFPIGIVLTWVPAITIGIWGAVMIPNLEGTATDNIIPLMAIEYLPHWIAGVGLIGILAMVMSSLDAQVLTISHFFTIDILGKYFMKNDEKNTIFYGRLIIVILLALSYIVALIRPGSLIELVGWAFTGYAIVLIPMLGGLFWKKCTSEAANSSLITGIILFTLYYFEILPEWTLFGFLPIVPMLTVQIFIIVTMTFVTTSSVNTSGFFEEKNTPHNVRHNG